MFLGRLANFPAAMILNSEEGKRDGRTKLRQIQETGNSYETSKGKCCLKASLVDPRMNGEFVSPSLSLHTSLYSTHPFHKPQELSL